MDPDQRASDRPGPAPPYPPPPDMAPCAPRDRAAADEAGILHVAITVLAAGGALFLLWQMSSALLLVFAGLLLAVLLDAAARGLEAVLPLRRAWSLTVVLGLSAAVAGAGLLLGDYTVFGRLDELAETLFGEFEKWRDELEALGMDTDAAGSAGDDAARRLGALLPNPGDLLERAQSAFTTVFGVMGDVIIVVFFGIFAAAQPALYRNGIVRLFPKSRRQRIGSVLDEAGHLLRWWLLGQLCAVILIGISTWAALALIGVPNAALLGLQAGIFSFIPYLGPVLGAVAIVLVAISQGAVMLASALGAYVVIQTIEGYVLTPLIQRRAVHLPPLLGLIGLITFGALFGVMGVALATPFVAILRLLVLRLYVEDTLGDRPGRG